MDYGYKYGVWRIEGKPHCYVVVDTQAMQCASVHVFEDLDEAHAICRDLEESAKTAAFWPNWDDPEVVGLANSKEFTPRDQENVETMSDPVYLRHEAARVIARRRAGLDENLA